MIAQHKSFPVVPDYTVLWQYMSLAKFFILIRNRKLHLHRIDDFTDKEEGVLSLIDRKGLPFFSDTDKWKDYFEKDRQRTFVSCWIKSPHELSLMWDTYGKEGLAIKTTAGALRKALKVDTEHTIYMIEVRYIDKKMSRLKSQGHQSICCDIQQQSANTLNKRKKLGFYTILMPKIIAISKE